MSARGRQLVIGVDAMEWTLVERWAAAGVLPTFRRLLDGGLRARLASPADALPDTAWTTVAYGVNPGKLEKYFYVQYDPAAGRLRHATDAELAGTPFWTTLAAAGRRVGVVDVPHVPLRPVDAGFVLRGWGAHDIEDGPQATPSTLAAEVAARFGRHPVGDCERYDAGARRRLYADVLAGVRRHGELFRWLLRARPSDVFVGVFSASHCAGHHFWPDDTADDADDVAGALEQVYRAVDRELGETMACAGPDATTLVVAAHGMGPLSHASWNLNDVLDLLGYGRPGRGPAPPAVRRARPNPWRLVKMTVPSTWQYAVKTRLPAAVQARLLYLWYAGRRGCGGRRAFAVPNNETTGAIRIGVRGRDAGGLVAPGAEHRRLRDEVAAALRELVDPASGRPVVARVTALHDVCHGPFVERLPDLAVLWDGSFAWHALRSPRFGTLAIARQDRRLGSHTPHAFLLASGPGVPAGAEVAGHATVDVAATVLRRAGVAVPDGHDGVPIAPLG